MSCFLDYLERNSSIFANEKSIIPTNPATIKDIITTVTVSCIVSALVGHVTCFSSSRKPVTNDFGFCIRVLYHIYMTSVFVESIIISLGVLFGFLISHVVKGGEEVVIIALLFIVYFLGKKFFPHHAINKDYVFDSFIFTIAVIIIVMTSGGLISPLFFLLYFLLFGIGLLVKPLVSLTTAITVAVLLLYSGGKLPASSLPTLMSLPLITPFAVLLGNEFHKARRLAQSDSDIRERSFMFLSTVLKEHINRIGEIAANFKGDHELEGIKRIVRRTQKLIDRFEKDIEQL